MKPSRPGWWVVVVFLGLGFPAICHADDYEQKLKTTLLVQAAMQQARECLKLGEYGTAVRLLEGQLGDANGSVTYLAILEEAYRYHIAKLQKDGRDDLAKKYQERWAILKPQVKESSSLAPTGVATRAPTIEAPRQKPLVIRGQDDKESTGGTVDLAVAHQHFEGRRYQAASQVFKKMADSGMELPPASQERWAYCKLFVVTQQLNHPPSQGLDFTLIETEIRQAMALAPKLDYGPKLLNILHERQGQQPSTPPETRLRAGEANQTDVFPKKADEKSEPRHLTEQQDGWQIAESANFRLFHRNRATAMEVLEMAEKARHAVQRKWLGIDASANWPQRCNIYLHPTGQDYVGSTHMPADSPGHSDVRTEAGDATKILGRRIDLRADVTFMLPAILPHEVTHVTLAGQFGSKPLPRWADEGLAMLSETYDRIGQQLQPLAPAYESKSAFSVQEILQTLDYPDASRMGVFYAQSICLVQFLTEQRGPVAFTTFLKDANQQGYEQALRVHYGLETADLDQRLRQYVVVQGTPSLTTGGQR